MKHIYKQYLLALGHGELYTHTIEDFISQSIDLAADEISDLSFDILLDQKDVNMFLETRVDDYLDGHKITWSRYRVNDKILKIINDTDTEVLIEKLSKHYFNNPIGTFSDEERTELIEKSQDKAFARYRRFIPEVKNLVQTCIKNDKYLYYLDIRNRNP